ncbi:MAG TPA: hypothetical protein VKV31_00535 [bacterium]|nr:hypothetical protein [bacterium]
MMRTVEAMIAVAILVGGVAGLTAYLQLPPPKSVYSDQLYNLGESALQQLTASGVLQTAAFNPDNPLYQGELQSALQAILPANVVYNLTYYNVTTNTVSSVNTTQYTPIGYISNSGGSQPKFTVTVSFVVPSPNLTFVLKTKPYPSTVFILNCSDALGWWITGYTASALATNLKQLLTQRTYFQKVITINKTGQLYTLLSSGALQVGNTQYSATNSIIINVFGESIPIPQQEIPSGATSYDEWLGQQVRGYNITWVQVVGWPFYEISNTQYFNSANKPNGYSCGAGYPYFGIVGICGIGGAGLNSFTEGFTGGSPCTNGISVGAPGGTSLVSASTELIATENYYGIYVSPYQSSSRPLQNPQSCGLIPIMAVFNSFTSGSTAYYPAEVYTNSEHQGFLIDIGLVRIPDIRITALALLEFFHPQVIPSTNFATSGYTRLVVLQLGEL